MKLIISSDYHLRKDTPLCRTDSDWILFQKKVLVQIADLCKKYKANLAIVGDIFHRSKEDVELLQLFFNSFYMKDFNVYIIDGNHDIKYHNWSNKDKSNFGILWALTSNKANNLFSLSDIGYAHHFDEEKEYQNEKLVFLHELTMPSITKHKLFKYTTPKLLKKQYPEADFIFTGDMHKPFFENIDDTVIVNMGSITIQNAELENIKPSVWLVDTEEKGKVTRLELDSGKEFIDSSYLKKDSELSERIEDFVEELKKNKKITLDFVENLRESMKTNKFNKQQTRIILDMIERI